MTAGRGMCLRLSCQFMAGFVALECARHLLCSCFSGSLDLIRLRGVGERSLVKRSMKSATWFISKFVAYCGKRGSWLVARIGITVHLAVDTSQQRAKLLLHFEWRYAGSWLWEWYESDSFAWNNESSFFLIGLRCTHCTFEDLHNAEAEAELVSFEVSICLFWNNYYLLYCPVKSDILSFHFHNHLSDRSFALLSRAMVASCQARPSVRIVLMMEEGKPKQTTCHASFPR